MVSMSRTERRIGQIGNFVLLSEIVGRISKMGNTTAAIAVGERNGKFRPKEVRGATTPIFNSDDVRAPDGRAKFRRIPLAGDMFT